ncbi:MAG TPA: class A beta-lactamase [Acidimicrobiales bacterium]
MRGRRRAIRAAWAARAVVAALAVLAAAAPGCSSGGPGASDASAGSTTAPGESTVPAETASPEPEGSPVAAAFARLEAAHAARLGVYAVDTGSGETVEYRADERFPFASTHKVLSAAAVLRDTSAADLDEVVRYERADLVSHSPVTEAHVDTGLRLGEVIRAAITVSDNTAANLLFERLGGPAGLEAVVRDWGDDTTSFDRWEPELGDWAPGETRDTSTPRVMAAHLEALALGSVLDEEDRAFLVDALRASTTGSDLVRSAVPDGWVAGDKTGTSTHGGRNDIAVVWPPGGAPIVVAIYTHRLDPAADPANGLIAEAAEVVLDRLAD